MAKSRVKNSVKNLKYSTAYQIMYTICAFITRTVFIRVLGEEFLGINSLFANIVSFLSLADLGISTAISYRLYKPLADKDVERQRQLVNFYKLAYRYIGLAIFVMGMCLLPFIPYFIKDLTIDINVYLFFFLYLMRTCVSYWFFSYKRTIIVADQKSYIIKKVDTIYQLTTNLLQIIVLVVTRDFLLYTITFILVKIVENLIIGKISERMYPQIKEKPEKKLAKEEVLDMFKDCYALFFYKINSKISLSLDNIVISTNIGLSAVGLCSNYLLILEGVKQMTNIVKNSVSASVGDLNAGDDTDKKLKIYFQLNYMIAMIYIFLAVGFFINANNFITLWLGANFLLPLSFVFILSLDLLTLGVCVTLGMFRQTMGLFQQAKYRPLISSFINLTLSLLLVKDFGIQGVFAATIISRMTTYFIYDPHIIFTYGFKVSKNIYYIKTLIYFIIFSCSVVVSKIILNLFVVNTFFMLIIGIIVSILVTTFFIVLFSYKTNEFKSSITTVKKILKI